MNRILTDDEIYFEMDQEHRKAFDEITNEKERKQIMLAYEKYLFENSNGHKQSKDMATLVNCCNSTDEKIFVHCMANEHPTLQQAFARLCFRFIKIMADKHDTKNYDLRNEASVLTAKKIVDTFKDDLYLPLV